MTAFLVNTFNRMSGNRHTTAAGTIYVVAKFGCPILSVWFPDHKAQFETTAGYLEGAAVFYGFASAGDGNKAPEIGRAHV